jgi:hypothetical protein
MSAKRDHVVPQQHLKRFCNSDKAVWSLSKPDLRIGSKPHTPKSICYEAEYYTDAIGRDFDEEYLKPIEDEFGRQSALLQEQPEEDLNLIWRWFISMLARSRFAEQIINQTVSKAEYRSSIKKSRFLIVDQFLRLFREWDCFLNVFEVDGSEPLVTTDSPICMHTFRCSNPPIFLMPLSGNRLFVSGPKKFRDPISEILTCDVNLLMFAWCEKYTYSSSRDLLSRIKNQVSDPHPEFNPAWFGLARLPFFGVPESGEPPRPIPPLLLNEIDT